MTNRASLFAVGVPSVYRVCCLIHSFYKWVEIRPRLAPSILAAPLRLAVYGTHAALSEHPAEVKSVVGVGAGAVRMGRGVDRA
eukprot:6181123-Pleurochrysis_carterae.AAC.2